MRKPKCFYIEIDAETHKAIKMRALFRNMTMSNYILQAIAEKIIREDKYQKEVTDLYEN